MVIVDDRNVLTAQLEDKGLHLHDFYEGHQVMSMVDFCKLPLQRRADVLLVDTATVLNSPALQETFKTVLNTFLGVVFFHEHKNQTAQAWVQDQAAFLTKILGECSLPMPQLQWTMLSNQLQFFWTVLEEQKNLQKSMTKFSLELDQVLQTAEWEMAKAKKIHETLIPKRTDEIKGVNFINKYAAGDGGGGEFYDLFQGQGKVYQILVSSQSYLISSSLMGLLNLHKQKDFSPAAFVAESKNEIATINSAKKNKSEAEVMVLEMDQSHLTLKSYGSHKSELFSRSRGKISLDSDYQLERGEKVIVFSPGFLFNWKESELKEDVTKYLNSHQHLGQQELLMELFYKISLNKTEFLKRDATVVMMEVNRHGMHQV
jgi:hypothetical protein